MKASPPGALQFQDLECAFAAGDLNPLRARGNDGAGFVATFTLDGVSLSASVRAFASVIEFSRWMA